MIKKVLIWVYIKYMQYVPSILERLFEVMKFMFLIEELGTQNISKAFCIIAHIFIYTPIKKSSITIIS